jgi:hypothetical protein
VASCGCNKEAKDMGCGRKIIATHNSW